MYEPGAVIAGKYRVERRIGRGGMGVVLACEHVDLRTRVAVKLLGDRYIERASVVERFVREARACAQLHSDHVCRVFDVGREGSVPYIVMELLEGSDLARVLRKSGALDIERAADYVVQACEAIGEAHALGIVHRDLKPSNLFLTQGRHGEDLLKVLDFGVAKAQGEQDLALTGTDTVVGSPVYMAPEQLRSARNADARSDVWSLGVILYELACGRPPWSGETVIDLALRIAQEQPEIVTNVPPVFAAIIMRCLQKDPALRFQSVGELAEALAPFVAARPVEWLSPGPSPSTSRSAPHVVLASARSPVGENSDVQQKSTTLRSAAASVEGQARQPSGRLVIAAVAAIGVGIGAAAIFSRSGGGGGSGASDETHVIAPAHPAEAQTPTPTPSPNPNPAPSLTPSPIPNPSPSPSPSPTTTPSPTTPSPTTQASTAPATPVAPTTVAKPKLPLHHSQQPPKRPTAGSSDQPEDLGASRF